jgi:hypothetical protein
MDFMRLLYQRNFHGTSSDSLFDNSYCWNIDSWVSGTSISIDSACRSPSTIVRFMHLALAIVNSRFGASISIDNALSNTPATPGKGSHG